MGLRRRRHRRRPLPGHHRLAQGTDREEPRLLQGPRASRTRRSSSCSTTSTPSTTSSTTTARCSGSRPTSTRRAAASSPSTSRKPERANWKEIIPQSRRTRLQGVERRRRPVRRALPARTRAAEVKVFDLDGKLVARGRAARHRHGRRLRRQAQRHRDVLRLHQLHHARRRSIATTWPPARARVFRAAEGRVRPRRLRDEAGLLHEQGRHAGADVPHRTRRASSSTASNPDAALRLRRLQHLAHAGVLASADLVWLEMGGVYAVANLRGGGEYGEDWHQAGMKLQEAERLRRLHRRGRVADREQVHVAPRSSPSRAAATAACSSARCMTQRPDLFGAALPGGRRDGHAALPQVHHRLGLGQRLRLVRRRRGVQGAATPTRRCTTSSPARSTRRRWSPPPTTTTASCPAHSFKFAAALQAAPGRRQRRC